MIQFNKIFSKNKFIFILILFLGCLLISAVNAAEADNNNLTSDSDSILIGNSNEAISQENVYSFDDLSDLINKTPENQTLTLDADYTFVNGSNSGIIISKPITIDGAGHTLNGTKLSRIFNISADNVVLKNINFINGNTIGSFGVYYGGGAILWNGNDGHVTNCSFTDNSEYTIDFNETMKQEIVVCDDGTMHIEYYYMMPAGATTSQGGAIAWIGNNGKVENSTFKRNCVGYANNGGAIYWAGDNGSILNSEFYDNDAYRGAAIYWDGINGTVSLSKFLNSGICDSGIFWMGKNGVIKNSILLKLYGDQDVISPYSVDVKADFNFWGDTVENPNLVNKSSKVKYWALLDYSSDKDFVFEGENFTINYNFNKVIAKSGTLYTYNGLASKSGNVVFTANKTGLVNVSFNNNEFNVDVIPHNVTGDFYDLLVKIHNTPEGGLLVLDRDYQFTNGSNKGILISKSITIDGNGHTLNGNKSSRIFNITAGDVVIRNVNFINGNAFGQYFSNSDIGGGAIYWSGSNGFVENCNFTQNSGWGIENDPFECNMIILEDDGMIFYGMKMRPMGAKTNEGGAIVWKGENGTVSRCIFTHNSVGYPNTGGAICWRGDSGKIIESEFYENDAWCGSAIAWIGNNGTILSSTIANSTFFDGGIYWFGENGFIRDSILLGNDYRAALRTSGGSVDADYNFWGDTLNNPNQEYKINNVTKWLVMNFTHNGEFVKKGQKVVISWDITNLIDKNGNVSKYYALINKSGEFEYTATKDGYLVITLVNGIINVNVDSKDKITSKDQTSYYSSKTTYKVRISDVNGKVVGKYVKFTINGKTYSVKTDKNGVATLKINLKPGKYNVNIAYGSAKAKNKITVKTTLITKDISKKVKNPGLFIVQVLNSKGKSYAKQVVKIIFKGNIYKIKTNSMGLAILKIPQNLKVGKYTVKTTYNGLTNTNKIIVKK